MSKKKSIDTTSKQSDNNDGKKFLEASDLLALEKSASQHRILSQEIVILEWQIQAKKLEVQVKNLECQLLTTKQQNVKSQIDSLKVGRRQLLSDIKSKHNITTDGLGYDDLTGEIKEDTSNG